MEKHYFDQEKALSYQERARQTVPGYDSLHKMVSLLLSEKISKEGRILVVGAGGGLEIKALADDHATWFFEGVDPSEEMIKVARKVISCHSDRINLKVGYSNSASEEMFDGATALLVFHFMSLDERVKALKEIHCRLKPGAPFILVHFSFSQNEPERTRWMVRHISYSQSKKSDPSKRDISIQTMQERLTILEPNKDEDMLREAGFTDVELFYTGLALKGWVVYA